MSVSQLGSVSVERMPSARPSFTPIQIMELEIGLTLPDIRPATDERGRLFERGMALVRLHDQPLGTIQFDLPPEGVDRNVLGTLIWDALGAEARDHLQSDGLPAVPPFAQTDSTVDVIPRCIAARDDFLARAPFVTIVVATRNRPDTLARCLDSLMGLVYPEFDVIVVDNAPRDDATERFVHAHFAQRPQVRYVREDRPGLASAHNRGVREMSERSQFVAFTDDDVKADRYWLCELMRGFAAAENVGCVTGMIFPVELETWPQLLIEQFGGFNKGFRRRVYDLRGNRPDDRLFPYTPGRYGSGANMAFRTETLERIGGFDPAMGTGTPALGGDDLAAFFRVIVDGYTLVYEPAAIVHHTHYRDYRSLQKQIHGYGVGLTAYLTKSLLDRPRLALDLTAKAPAGIRYALNSRSGKNVKKGPDYPDELTKLERKGMIYGPIAYLRSRVAARRYRNQALPHEASVSPKPATTMNFEVAMHQRDTIRGNRVQAMTHELRRWIRHTVPSPIIRWGRGLRHRVLPPRIGQVNFGDLRRVTPISRGFGFDRGIPVDRYYIEGFLERHAADIQGRVLEIGDNAYTRRFGGDRVGASDILDVSPDNGRASFIGDLATADTLPMETFDCMILTQTLQLVYDLRAAIATTYHALKPGGVLLLTVPGISQIDDQEWNSSWYWMFTQLSVQRLLTEVFAADRVVVEAQGNVLSASAFLYGLAAEELTTSELNNRDSAYELVILARAVK